MTPTALNGTTDMTISGFERELRMIAITKYVPSNAKAPAIAKPPNISALSCDSHDVFTTTFAVDGNVLEMYFAIFAGVVFDLSLFP